MKRLLFLMIITSLLTACTEKKIVDELGLINGVSYDLSDQEDQYFITVSFPKTSEKTSEYHAKVIATNAKSSKEAKMKLMQKTNFNLVSGQARLALFGEEVAKKGIYNIVESLLRDPSIGSRIYLAVASSTGNEILNKKLIDEPDNVFYIFSLLDKAQMQNSTPSINLYEFTRDYYDDGIDPILPVFKTLDNEITLDGYSIFDDDRSITRIKGQNVQLLFILRKSIKNGNLYFELDSGEKIMLSYFKSKRDIQVKNKSSLKVDVHVHGQIQEYDGKKDLTDKKQIKELEKEMSDYLNEKLNTLIELLQENHTDPIGFGQYVRNDSTFEDWKKINWNETYKNLSIDVKSTIKISDIGKVKR
ncbi:spore germination protein [Bacillus pakistanensis]|uniref:Spore germination protein n=1 Tax=Rossellomorea pakistanensis TaxID=992288 RepID=A0ABS2N830_9BACI|nr:Ger(x)C family spore germination protein [Bacillus pakistanensis]MBM7584017.1 spore germination protein [Bacillus pakistanensis]